MEKALVGLCGPLMKLLGYVIKIPRIKTYSKPPNASRVIPESGVSEYPTQLALGFWGNEESVEWLETREFFSGTVLRRWYLWLFPLHSERRLSTGVYNYAAYNKGLFCYHCDYGELLRRLISLGFFGAPKRRRVLWLLENWRVTHSINRLNHELSTGPVDVRW